MMKMDPAVCFHSIPHFLKLLRSQRARKEEQNNVTVSLKLHVLLNAKKLQDKKTTKCFDPVNSGQNLAFVSFYT